MQIETENVFDHAVMKTMKSFDLADALEDLQVGEKEEVSETSSCNPTQVVQRDTVKLEEGLELVVSKNTKTLQCSAVVLMAVTRLKKPLGHRGTALRENELCNTIFGCLVEETIVNTKVNWSSKAHNYQRADSETQCTLSDPTPKSLVYETEQMKLQAVCLQGGYEDRKVNFTLSRYETKTRSGDQTFLLSINKSIYLSCSMKENRPELILERRSLDEVNEIGAEGNMHRFLFWKRIEAADPDQIKFESVSCPSWFISTSLQSGETVDMCRAEDVGRYRILRMD